MAEKRNEVPERVRPLEAATGLPWQTLVDAFEAAGGASLTHSQLAEAILPVIAERIENAGWWAQGAVVAYEQQIGRRVAGQSSRGDFQVSVSRTLPVVAAGRSELRDRTGEAVLAAAGQGGNGAGGLGDAGAERDGGVGGQEGGGRSDAGEQGRPDGPDSSDDPGGLGGAGGLGESGLGGTGFGGFTLEGEPRTSDTPKRLYWRCGLSRGAKLEISMEAKAASTGEERTLVTLTVTGLASAEEREAVRADLKRVLAGI